VTRSPRRHSLTKSLTPIDPQQGAHGLVGAIDRPHNRGLDLACLVEVDQHDVAQLEPLDDVLHRHETSVDQAELVVPSAWGSSRLLLRSSS